MSSFTELTPVQSCCSSTSTPSLEMDSEYAMRAQRNINAFHEMLAELEGDETPHSRTLQAKPQEEEQFLDIEELPDTYEEDVVDVSDSEDDFVGIKYPYERKDVYDGLKERIEQRLNDSGDEQLEKEAKEIAFLVKMKQAEWKEEDRLERQKALLKSTIFTCVMCSKAFPDSEQLQKHTAQMHDLSGNKWKCERCGKAYKYRKNLESHMDYHLKEFPCKDCSLVFKTEPSLHAHQLKEHREKEDEDLEYGRSKCPHCELHFSDKIFKRHVYYCLNKEKIAEKRKIKKAQSTPSSPALSTISCASFTSYQPGPSGAFPSPLVSPSVVSYRDKSCAVCGEAFASRQSMLRHVGRKHPEVKNDPSVTAVRYVNSVESPSHQYACVDCGKRLTTRAALTTHRARAHSAQAGSECPHCPKTFIVPSELRKHIQRVHNKDEGSSQITQKMKGQQLTDLPDIDDIF